jgi:hypothetical protein
VEAKEPYDYPYLPPFTGALHPPVQPGPDGHFDYLEPGSRDFLAAHCYACIRRTLDVFEGYNGEPIPWFFASAYERLEVVPYLSWDNAQSGFGYLEMGEDYSRGTAHPFALNFDAISHEIGHLIVFGKIGVPEYGPASHDFFAFHEAAADFISLLGLLSFDTVLERVLRRTKGNLLILNELDRFAELSDEKQIRSFNHSLKVRDVGLEVHDYSKPFAGGLFDLFVEFYQWLSFDRGISDLNPRLFRDLRRELSASAMERLLSTSREEYSLKHFAAKAVLAEARDAIGKILLKSWSQLRPETMTFRSAADAMIYAVEDSQYNILAEQAFDIFAWREIV